MNDVQIFAAIVEDAQARLCMTPAEFDFSLRAKDGRAAGGIYEACYAYANSGDFDCVATSDLMKRYGRATDLHVWLAPLIAQRVDEASARSYTGWSTASGGPIRYGKTP